MSSPAVITSPKNERIKELLSLEKASVRKAKKIFCVEGLREIERALHCHYDPVEAFFCDAILSLAGKALLTSMQRGAYPALKVYEVSRAVFARIAMRESHCGLAVVFRQKAHSLAALQLRDQPVLLAIEGLEKPGNLGALLRTADGAGCAGVVVLNPGTDIYNPNVVRASLGTLFSVPTVTATNEEFAAFCKEQRILIFGAALHPRSQRYDQTNLASCVVLLGAEAYGLSSYWLDKADKLISIPMLGIADSLNVAAAGAVLLYEALRQRAGSSMKQEP